MTNKTNKTEGASHTYLSRTYIVRKGDVVPGFGFDIQIVGNELNDPKVAVGRRIGTDQYFLVEGVEYA